MDARSHAPQTEHSATHRREAGLDIVRGLAVLGTFATNVWLFTHPAGLLGTLFDPLAGIDSMTDLMVYGLAAGLANGKFLALLMMVFGMGITIQFAAWNRRTAREGERPGSRRAWLRDYMPRALVLLLDGAVNFVLVAEFDILMGYAFTGFVVAALIAGSPRSQRVGAWIAGLVHVCGLLVVAAAVFVDEGRRIAQSGAAGQSGPADLSDQGASLPQVEAAAEVLATGSFLDLALFRLDHVLLFRIEPVLTIALGVCLFLVGAAVFDRGVFTAEGGRLRRRLMLVGAAVLPFDLLLGFMGLSSFVLVQRYLTAPLVALGVLGLVAHLARTRAVRTAPGRWAAAVGRMSLSVYVAQNLLAGALFYGWGLGLASRFPDHRVLMSLAGFAVVIAAMVAFAVLWQRRAAPGAVRRGPLEALTHAVLPRR